MKIEFISDHDTIKKGSIVKFINYQEQFDKEAKTANSVMEGEVTSICRIEDNDSISYGCTVIVDKNGKSHWTCLYHNDIISMN